MNRTIALACLLLGVALGAACEDSDDGGDATTGTTSPGGGGAAPTGGAGGTGGSDGGGGSGAGASGSVETDYCARLATFVCAEAEACNCGAALPTGELDEAACVQDYTRRCIDAYAQLVEAVASGTVYVDVERAHACVDLIAATSPSCERPRGTVALGLCEPWFYDLAASGEACSAPICAGGEGYCPEGTCVARPGVGATCFGYECEAGLLCIDAECVAPAEAGASCVADDACRPPLRCVAGECRNLLAAAASCSDVAECALGLDCVGGECTAVDPAPCTDDLSCGNLGLCGNIPRCAVPAAIDEACASDDGCESGLYCASDTSLCTALPGDGSPCANGVLCAVGSACTSDFGTCAPAPGSGEPCAFGPMGPFVCAEGLGCLVDTCGPLPGEGAACTVDSRCESPLGCDFTAEGSFCAARRPAGGECQNDQICEAGLHCDFAVASCAPDYALGVPCSMGNECGPAAVCLPGSGGGYVCSPMPELGDACQFDCAEGLTCATDPALARCIAPICAEL